MTIVGKRRLVGVLLAGAALWPLVHLGLVARYDLSRWKLAGWGMYTEPGMENAGLEIYGRRAVNGAREQLTAPNPRLRATAEEFLYDYRWLRRLCEPHAVAEAAFATQPEWRQLDIDVFRPFVEPRSGLVEQEHVRYRYGASEVGARLLAVETSPVGGLPGPP